MKLGDIELYILNDGYFSLDGGAMFGVVPKPLWERRIPADPRNRIPLAMRCLLIEHPDGLVLIDTAVGNKDDAKFRDIYGIENPGHPTALEDAIRETGHQPGEVQWVINTHLHFDHAGGNTVANEAGEVKLTFPGAVYTVQRGELDFAAMPNERIRASYLLPNFAPVAAAGRFRLISGEVEVLPGIRCIPTPGHVPYHQSVLVQDEDESALFLGDLCPTAAHLPAAWIMGYDVEPLVTLATKKEVLARAAREGWALLFEHDPIVARATVGLDQKKGWTPEPVTKVEAPAGS